MKNRTFVNLLRFDGRSFVRGNLSVCDGRFTASRQTETVDLGGAYVIPGMVDVHTHGRRGVDFGNADGEQLSFLKREYARIGVTTVVPTLASAPFDQWITAVERAARANFSAVHLEGRYLSPQKRGIHSLSLLSLPDTAELDALCRAAGRMHLHITLAPELDGADRFTAEAIRRGCTVGIGHTAATTAQTDAALAAGAISFSHLFNAMPSLHHRQGGPVCRALTGDAYTELICDGFHIEPAVVALVRHCKRPDRVVLISDSIEAAGEGDGDYVVAGEQVFVRDGKALSADGVIGGSTLSLCDAMKNYMSFTGAPLADAVAAVTENPARMLGLRGRCGGLDEGMRADFCIVETDGTLRAVFVAGEEISL